MKTPYLDNLIKGLEDGQNKSINSYYLNCQLRELKDIKKQLNLFDVSKSLMDKKWAEARERTARVREQIAIEKFIEVYWDEDYTPTFEEINERLKLH